MFRLDYHRLYRIADQSRSAFRSNGPFPNIAIDNFLPQESYEFIKKHIPSTDDWKIWKLAESDKTKGKLVTRTPADKLKERQFGILRPIFLEFNSGSFLRFLERLSKIPQLIGDPYFREAGFHSIIPGGWLASHADYSHHPDLGLERRLNFFLYLNDDWQEDWGGHLSLYDTEGNEIQKHLPIANRAVIFETSETSFHGHPHPLKCPLDKMRQSIALYYYSNPRETRPKSKIIFQ